MSKKSFTGDVNSLLGSVVGESKSKSKRGRPKDKSKRIPTKSSQEGTKNNETRATFIVNEELLEKVKALAWFERRLIKEVINEALLDYLDKVGGDAVSKILKDHKKAK